MNCVAQPASAAAFAGVHGNTDASLPAMFLASCSAALCRFPAPSVPIGSGCRNGNALFERSSASPGTSLVASVVSPKRSRTVLTYSRAVRRRSGIGPAAFGSGGTPLPPEPVGPPTPAVPGLPVFPAPPGLLMPPAVPGLPVRPPLPVPLPELLPIAPVQPSASARTHGVHVVVSARGERGISTLTLPGRRTAQLFNVPPTRRNGSPERCVVQRFAQRALERPFGGHAHEAGADAAVAADHHQ